MMVPAVVKNPEGVAVPGTEVQRRRLKETCQEFEAMLTNYIFKSMRQSVVRAEQQDPGGQLYESMMDESLSRELSRHESGGLADMLYRELLPLLAKDTPKAPSTGEP